MSSLGPGRMETVPIVSCISCMYTSCLPIWLLCLVPRPLSDGVGNIIIESPWPDSILPFSDPIAEAQKAMRSCSISESTVEYIRESAAYSFYFRPTHDGPRKAPIVSSDATVLCSLGGPF
ncbi:hypothetical protein VTK73DRAFT_2928 [Phialemonium thermophilum]|uniref:Uncharacterized protein n=1 Tax=Phialemonium thermophilum TaxID=223376 RepID=A0ABR3VMH6_9PEZI